MLYNVVQCCTMLYNVVQCCTMLCNVVQWCAMVYNGVHLLCNVVQLLYNYWQKATIDEGAVVHVIRAYYRTYTRFCRIVQFMQAFTTVPHKSYIQTVI